MKKSINVLLTCLLVLCAGVAIGANIDVSQPSYCTTNNAYDRNPSVIYDGANYWLFYTKGDDVSTDGVRGPTYDPDGDTYVVYYKTASTIDGLAGVSETKLTLSESNRPTGFDQRVVSATAFNGKIYAFVSSGQSGTDRGLYYYEYSGGGWSGPTTLIADATASGAHVNVTSDNSYVYIVWESSDGSSDCYTWNGTTLSSKIDISGGNQPKITYYLSGKSGNLFVVNIEDDTGDIEVFFALASPNPLFSHHSTAIPGGGFYDPCIFTDGIDLYVVSAPWVAVDRQYLIQAKFDVATSTWSDTKVVSYGGYGDTEWWDFWPCGICDGADIYLFFATETNSPVFSDAEIAFIKMDWDLTNDHYFYIQNAVDQASANDTIAIADGLYVNSNTTVDKPVTIIGESRDGVIIAPSAEDVGTGTSDFNGSYQYGFMVVSNDVTIENLTIDGRANNTANGGALPDHNNFRTGIANYNESANGFNDLQVKDVDIRYTRNHGVSLGYSGGLVNGGHVVSGCNIEYVEYRRGISSYASYCTISGNNISNVGMGIYESPSPALPLDAGVVTTISGNTLTNIGGFASQYYGHDWPSVGIYFRNPNVDATIIVANNDLTIGAGDEAAEMVGVTGMYIYNADNSSIIEGNTINALNGTDNWGIYLGGCGGTIVSNNIFLLNGTDRGIFLGRGNPDVGQVIPNIITGNTFTSTGSAADTLAGGTGIVMSDIGSIFWMEEIPYHTDNIITHNNINGFIRAIMIHSVGSYQLNATITDNDFSGSLLYGVDNGSNPIIVNASNNWWGTTDYAAVASALNGNVDYTPWLGGGVSTDPGFQGNYTELWVDDSSPQTGPAGYIEEGIDLVSGSTVNLAAGTYNETATIDKTLSLIGAGVNQTFVTGGVAFSAGISDVTVQHIYITGVAASNSIIRSDGVNTNLTIDDCIIDGEEIAGRMGYGGGSLEGDVTITNSEFMNVAGWSLFDSKSGSGGDGSPLGTVTFADNYIHECDGSIVFRGLSTDRTDVVNIYNNTWENIGDNFATPSQHWAAFEVNHAIAANIYDNAITNVVESEWGEGQGFQLWDIGTLDMHDNTITDCFQGVFIFDGELGGDYGGPYEIPAGSIYHNTITGFTDYAMSVGPNCTGTSLNAELNYWGSVNCQEFSGSILGNVDFEPYCNSTFSQCDFNCEVTEVWVNDDWAGSNEGDIVDGHVFGYNAFATIQNGIDNVIASTVHVLNGTYTEAPDINKSLTLSGESEAGVIIDASSFSDYGLYASGDLTITLENFTLIGPPSPTFGYGVKISGENAIVSISHVTVQDCGRSGFDLNGITSGNLQSLTATNNGGVGLALSDCDNVIIENLQTSGNAWAGVGIFTYGQYYTGGSDNITFTGSNTIPDLLYTQIDNYSDPGNPYPITNLTIPISLFAYTASNNLAPTFIVYLPDLTTAIAAVIGGPDPVNSFIIERASGEFYVSDGMTIQAAINAAGEGDLINVLTGTYPEALNVATNNLNIIGAGRTDVTIDAGGLSGYNSSGIYVTGDGVTLQGFTFVGEPSAATPRYGIKYGDVVGGALTDVLITEFFRTGVDMLGTDGLTLSNVESTNNGGNGIQTSDGRNITFNNITTDGNAWGGIGIFTYGNYTPLGVENIVFTGTNSFGETGTDNGGLYLEEGNFSDPANPEPITFSDDPLDMADVTVQLSDFVYFMRGDSDNEDTYTRFYTSLSDILSALAGSPDHIMTNRTMQNLMFPHNFYVYDIPGGMMTIQAAIDACEEADIINVAAGTYEEAILITKPLTMLGATAGVNKNGYTVPADYAWDDEVESIIVYPTPGETYNAIVDIYDTDDVTFDGFVVEELNAVGNLNTSLVRVYALTDARSNIAVINCVIGPNTNTDDQNGTHGRMGLYIVNHPYTDFGVTNSTFAHNKIFDCKGNGNNIFLWSSYFAYGAPGPASMSGTIIDDNEIYGSHRSGIESAGGFSGLTISNNTIYGNSGLPGDTPGTLKYGHGMLLIRGASDKVSDPLTAYGPVDLTIEGNDIFDNEKSGIYLGPKNDGITFTDNIIHDNGWDGIMVDLVGNYWNPTFEDPPVSGQYACYDCSNDISALGNSIYNNGLAGNPLADFGVQVNGVPTNAFEFDAEGNWWGAYCGPYHATLNPNGEGNPVSDYVDFDPWCNDDFTICTFSASDPAPIEVWVDDDYAVGLANDGHLWCIDAFAVIQNGVDAVADGGTVNVANGSYAEGPQVVIDKDVTIIGENKLTTIITPTDNTGSSGDSRGWFLVNDGANLNLSNVTLDGNSYQIYQAIRAFGTGTLNNNIFQNIIYSTYIGFALAHLDNWNVTNNAFTNIGRVGVLSYGTDVTGSLISGNIYTGKGEGDWLDYAFEAGAGAVTTISNNTITNCTGVADVDGSTSAGIIITTYYGIGTASTITGNNISNSTSGIAVGYDSDDESAVSVTDGNLLYNNEAGIQSVGGTSSSLTVNGNAIYGNTSFGIEADGSFIVDARSNWWGDPSGPALGTLVSGGRGAAIVKPSYEDVKGLSQPIRTITKVVSSKPGKGEAEGDLVTSGTGNAVTSNVDYSPWWGSNYVGNDHSSAWSWYVDISNSSTIMEGIDFTLEGDTVYATPAIYQGAGNKNIDFGGKNIVLAASEDVDNTIIDCQLSGRAVYFHNGESEAATVKGFTFKNGIIAGDGGAILCGNASSPTIANCLIIGNIVSGFGGGIACDGASNATIVNCTISKNTANGQYNSGGGIYCFDSSPIVKNTIVYENYGPGQNQIYSHTMSDYEPIVTYSDIQQGWLGTGNIDADPLFRNTDLNNPDFHLMAFECDDSYNSPCIDIGHPNIHDLVLGCENGLSTELSDLGAYGGGLIGHGYPYLPGDANMDGKNTGNDVTYLVNYFRSAPTSVPCYFDNGTGILWASADANGSCDITGNDVTKMVNYNRSDPTAPALLFCPQYQPLFPTVGDVPNPLPEGWPFCENPVVTGTKIIPTSLTE